MRKLFLKATVLSLFVFMAGTLYAQHSHSKSPLKILFVGYDPAKPMPEMGNYAPGMMSQEAFTKEYPVRMPAFKKLLSQYFEEVTTMDCRDWKPGDSKPYDVTIFDFRPTALEETRREKQPDGSTKYIPAKYLPGDYSKATIFIASTADEMGRGLGLKLDWLCLCLDADAHHVNTQHPIFKGPLEQVSPTMEMKKTPEGIYHYTTGDVVPKMIPMWRVDKVGYLENDDCRIGLVSRGNRFDEGPDTEIISSGVCAKDVGAVALGRQGNFFLWGFGASPAQMTEEAKKVFVNVVAYMDQFDGQVPITRKYNDRMATTNDVRETIAHATKESYEDYKHSIEQFNAVNAKTKKRIDEKIAAGEELTSTEKQQLTYLGHPQEIMSLEDYLKQNMRKYADRFGTDVAAYQKYMRENFDYIYCDPDAFFDYWIDEDVQEIGVPNHSVALLDKCIAMLQSKDRPELALRVLKRYTWEDFSTAGEWIDWLAKHRYQLYFSETDGYKFNVNTYY